MGVTIIAVARSEKKALLSFHSLARQLKSLTYLSFSLLCGRKLTLHLEYKAKSNACQAPVPLQIFYMQYGCIGHTPLISFSAWVEIPA